jgi:hypothetical protein
MLFQTRKSLFWIAFAFLIAACTFTSAQRPGVPDKTLHPPLAKRSDTPSWRTYRDETYAVELRFPSEWQKESGEEARFRGEDGYVFMDASSGYEPGEVCRSQANHKLLPFGSNPQIQTMTIAGQRACVVWPSKDQQSVVSRFGDAMLAVQYPAPVKILVLLCYKCDSSLQI